MNRGDFCMLKNNNIKEKVAKEGGLYVHIPFCRKKCLYCDFYSGARWMKDSGRYVLALLNELLTRKPEWPDVYRTIYIGGGTPSLLSNEEFERLTKGIFDILGERAQIEEFTIEVNPEDVTEEKAKVWRASGVNRVSMGVQSLDDEELKRVGRRHDSATAIKAYKILERYFDNISLDLIFGLPGQTLESLDRSLEGLIALSPHHISCYSLMYEERTALTKLRDMGEVKETEEDITVEMYRRITKKLKESGYRHYEISNYALPGFESRHNSSYWEGKPYIGMGSGAHSYDGGNIRRINITDFITYLNYYTIPQRLRQSNDDVKPYEIETLDAEERYEEFVMTRLRTTEGIRFSEIKELFGDEKERQARRISVRLQNNVSIELTEDGVRLTEEGMMTSDSVIVEFFD